MSHLLLLFIECYSNSLTVLKQEINGANETIDNVTSTPYNGWVRRMVPFSAEKTNYTVNSLSLSFFS